MEEKYIKYKVLRELSLILQENLNFERLLVYTTKINTKNPKGVNWQTELGHLQKSAQTSWKNSTAHFGGKC